jgi:hypothetical protein
MYSKMNQYLDAMDVLWGIVGPANPTLDILHMKRVWEEVLFVKYENGETHPFLSADTEGEVRTRLYNILCDKLPAEYHHIITAICVTEGSPEYVALVLILQRYLECLDVDSD